MSSDRAPPERPADEPTTDADERGATAETRRGLDGICTEPGARQTSDIETLVIEAQLVAEGHEPDNPATPVDEATGRQFRERIADTDLVPAWTRPWKQDGGNR